MSRGNGKAELSPVKGLRLIPKSNKNSFSPKVFEKTLLCRPAFELKDTFYDHSSMTFSLFMPRVLQVSPKRPSSSLLYCKLIGRRRESSKASEKSSALRLLFSTKSQAETQQQKKKPRRKGRRKVTHSFWFWQQQSKKGRKGQR